MSSPGPQRSSFRRRFKNILHSNPSSRSSSSNPRHLALLDLLDSRPVEADSIVERTTGTLQVPVEPVRLTKTQSIPSDLNDHTGKSAVVHKLALTALNTVASPLSYGSGSPVNPLLPSSASLPYPSSPRPYGALCSAPINSTVTPRPDSPWLIDADNPLEIAEHTAHVSTSDTPLAGCQSNPVKSLATGTPGMNCETSGRQIFALIIGNNEYFGNTDYKSLEYAVADANAIEGFLTKSMGLLPSNTISMRNATRQEMRHGFGSLEAITEGSEEPCIIIFYAGHGARGPAPNEWKEYTTSDHVVEMLCPSDMGSIGKDGKVIEGIADKWVGAQLSKLARVRGNNITFILDCCHSASKNRDDRAEETLRCLIAPPPITDEGNAIPESASLGPLINSTTTPRGVRISPMGFGFQSPTSHVLLAACGVNQKAYENLNVKHGYFTGALITVLQNRETRLGKETYLSLINNMKMPSWQVPHCTGVNRSRPLFNPSGSRSDPSYILCKSTRAAGLYENGGENEAVTMFAGLVEGARYGEEFDLYPFSHFLGEEHTEPFGKMRAAHVHPASTVLQRIRGQTYPAKIPQVFYAKAIDSSSTPLSIFCEDEKLLRTSVIKTRDLIDSPTTATLIVTVEGDNIYLERNDTVAKEQVPNLKRLPRELKCNETEKIKHVINSWQLFEYHLRRRPAEEDKFPHMQQIRMELHYLEGVNGRTNDPLVEHRPGGADLLATDPALVHVAEEHGEKPLGFTLYNDGDIDVYPYLFYFDPIQLTISQWSLVAAGQGMVDPPLPAHSRLAVGYGDGGALPSYLTLEEGEVEDIGFFKLFITCSPTNLRCISQEESPFDWGHMAGDMVEDAEGRKQLEKMEGVKWGVKVATVVQRKC